MIRIRGLLSSFFLLALPTFADSASILPGFESVTTPGMFIYSAPAVGDLNSVPTDGNEFVVQSQGGIVYAYKADGSLLWSYNTPYAKCSVVTKNNKGYSSPAVADLDNDGNLEVVVGYGGLGGKACGGGIVALNGQTGLRIWAMDLKAFAKKANFGALSHGVFNTPAIADVDGDGKKEIAFGSFDRNVYLLNYNGKIRAYFNAADSVWSSPTFAEVNAASPGLELIAATDISANAKLEPPTKNGGNLYAFKTAQRPSASLKCSFRNKECMVWMRPTEQVLFSSPAVGDVLPSNAGVEVVIQSGCFFPEGSSKKVGKWIKIFSGTNGKLLKTIPITACSPSSPALVDVNGDGALDIISTVNGDTAIGGDGKGRVVAWSGVVNDFLWKTIPIDSRTNRNDVRMGEFSSPVLADLDGNGSLEVVVTNLGALAVLDAKTGAQLSCNTSTCAGMLRFSATSLSRSTPAIADLNNDGKPEIIAVGIKGTGGAIKVFTDFANLGSTTDVGTAYATPWPTLKKSADRISTVN